MAGSTLSPPGEHPDLLPRGNDRIPFWAYVLAVAGLLALLAIVLLAMGRVPWCKCGYVKLWHGVVMSSENSQHITDWYTFSHIIHGFRLYGMLWLVGRQLAARAAPVAGDCWSRSPGRSSRTPTFVINRYREATIALDYYGDSVINSAADVLAMHVGLRRWPLACRSG